MTLKSIDLQLAVHKNGDAGFIQHQLKNKPSQDQAMLAVDTHKQEIHDRHKSVKTERSANAGIRDGQANGQSGGSRQGTSKDKKSTEPGTSNEPAHPFKGRHIDLSL
jgi:hypothetical protein